MRAIGIVTAFVLALGLTACGLIDLPLSTSDDVEGYEDLVASYENDPEAAARFDIFEAQADGIQALQLIERAITHQDFPEAGKPYLKSLAGQLTKALRGYTAMILECPGKDPETGACPDFDYSNAKVLAYRNLLDQATREILRFAAQGFLGAAMQYEHFPPDIADALAAVPVRNGR